MTQIRTENLEEAIGAALCIAECAGVKLVPWAWVYSVLVRDAWNGRRVPEPFSYDFMTTEGLNIATYVVATHSTDGHAGRGRQWWGEPYCAEYSKVSIADYLPWQVIPAECW